MPKTNLAEDTLPHTVQQALARLGANIATARKRRGIRQEELAAKAGVTHVTLRRAERGRPTTGIGAYFAALWALGLDREIEDLASPDRDEEGKTLERAHMVKRVRRSAGELSDDF
jgi:transcriptional regulator with XRE-family HTH domain